MSSAAILTIIGNLTDDPVLQFTPGGVARVDFTVAHNPRRPDRTGRWVDGEPLFMRCQAWRQLAEHITESLARGTRVVVTGQLEQGRWETETGEKKSGYRLLVDDLGPSLRYATATVHKATRAPDNTDPGPS